MIRLSKADLKRLGVTDVPGESKYHNEPYEVGGIVFQSKKEGRRYEELLLWEKAGGICDIERQVRYRLNVGGVHVADYYADFVYTEVATGKRVVEDTKGYRTEVYKIKRALVKACYGITILET